MVTVVNYSLELVVSLLAVLFRSNCVCFDQKCGLATFFLYFWRRCSVLTQRGLSLEHASSLHCRLYLQLELNFFFSWQDLKNDLIWFPIFHLRGQSPISQDMLQEAFGHVAKLMIGTVILLKIKVLSV